MFIRVIQPLSSRNTFYVSPVESKGPFRERLNSTKISEDAHRQGAKLHNSRPNFHSIELAPTPRNEKNVTCDLRPRQVSGEGGPGERKINAFNDFPWIL